MSLCLSLSLPLSLSLLCFCLCVKKKLNNKEPVNLRGVRKEKKNQTNRHCSKFIPFAKYLSRGRIVGRDVGFGSHGNRIDCQKKAPPHHHPHTHTSRIEKEKTKAIAVLERSLSSTVGHYSLAPHICFLLCWQDIDLVPTDIAAGLMLVEQQQKCREENLSTIVIENMPTCQSGPSAEAVAVLPVNEGGDEGPVTVMIGGDLTQSWMTVPMMTHYMMFALGSYGWPFYMYTHLFTGLCRLCAACR